MLMATKGPYALMVQPDDILISPREVDEHFGTMVCFHQRYALGDKHEYEDKDAFLKDLYLDIAGHNDQGEEKYDKLCDRIAEQFGTDYGAMDRAIDNALLEGIQKQYIVMPLYLLDHSGLAMQTESFNDPWDSGQVGWIYVSKADVLKEFGAAEMTDAIRQRAEDLMRSEVAVYDCYLRGECYGFELYKNGELTDSCWGFMGALDEVKNDMADYLPKECAGMLDELQEQEHPATIIKTLLKHAKLQIDQAVKEFDRAPRRQVLGDTR